jgi:ATP-dependent exoDNAse (exonuclease V) beta subunit
MQTALDAVKRLKGRFDFDDLDLNCEEALRLFRK